MPTRNDYTRALLSPSQAKYYDVLVKKPVNSKAKSVSSSDLKVISDFASKFNISSSPAASTGDSYTDTLDQLRSVLPPSSPPSPPASTEDPFLTALREIQKSTSSGHTSFSDDLKSFRESLSELDIGSIAGGGGLGFMSSYAPVLDIEPMWVQSSLWQTLWSSIGLDYNTYLQGLIADLTREGQ